MHLVRPLMITDGVLSASSVAESETLWDLGATYTVAQAVYRIIDGYHRRFVSLQNTNSNKVPEAEPTWWRDEGPTNRWAMFDETSDTVTEAADEIEVELSVPADERVDTLYLAALDGVSVRVQIEDPIDEAVVLDQTISLADPVGITDWYAWYFEPVLFKRELGLTDLPAGAGSTITVTIDKAGATARCGHLVGGFRKRLGDTRWGVRTEIRDYSAFIEDDFGNRRIVPRSYRKLASAEVILRNDVKDSVERQLADCRAQVRLYIADPDYISLWVLGTAKWAVEMSMPPNRSLCSLQLESNV